MSFAACCASAVSGRAGRAGSMNAQCGRYSAPFSIHCSRMAICCAESVLCVDSGGMRSSTFCERMRRTSSLRDGIAGHDRVATWRFGQLLHGELADIEPQTRFARRRIGAMTLETVLREDRTDVPVVVDLVGRQRAQVWVRPRAAAERGRCDDGRGLPITQARGHYCCSPEFRSCGPHTRAAPRSF